MERTLPLPVIPLCVVTDDGGSVAFMGMSDFAVHRIDLAADKPEATPIGTGRHGSYVTGLVRSAGTLVSGGYDGALIWWDTASGAVIRTVADAHARWIRRLAISPDGWFVAAGHHQVSVVRLEPPQGSREPRPTGITVPQ